MQERRGCLGAIVWFVKDQFRRAFDEIINQDYWNRQARRTSGTFTTFNDNGTPSTTIDWNKNPDTGFSVYDIHDGQSVNTIIEKE